MFGVITTYLGSTIRLFWMDNMIQAIFVDAFFTTFTLRDGKTRYDIMQKIIYGHAGVVIPIEQITDQNRLQRARWENASFPDYASKWVHIDQEMLAGLGVPDPQGRVARAMHQGIMNDPAIFEVKEDMRAFLGEAQRRGVKVIIASNSDLRNLGRMVDTFGLAPLLHRAYSSQEVGYEKPSKEFFDQILTMENLASSHCLMVGNNPLNDMQGCHAAGLVGVLYDPRDEYADFEGYRIATFGDIWALDLWEEHTSH